MALKIAEVQNVGENKVFVCEGKTIMDVDDTECRRAAYDARIEHSFREGRIADTGPAYPHTDKDGHVLAYRRDIKLSPPVM